MDEDTMAVYRAVAKIVTDEAGQLLSRITGNVRRQLDQWNLAETLSHCEDTASSDRDALAKLLAQVEATAAAEYAA